MRRTAVCRFQVLKAYNKSRCNTKMSEVPSETFSWLLSTDIHQPCIYVYLFTVWQRKESFIRAGSPSWKKKPHSIYVTMKKGFLNWLTFISSSGCMKQNHLDPDFFFLNGLHIYLKKCTLCNQPLDEMQLSKFNTIFFQCI